jgi:hypothetical protein
MPHRLFFTVVPPRRTAQSYGGWFKRPIGLVASYFGFAVADVMQMRRRCGAQDDVTGSVFEEIVSAPSCNEHGPKRCNQQVQFDCSSRSIRSTRIMSWNF